MAGASVTETSRMLYVFRGTVSKVMTAFETEAKISSRKHRSGRKSKLTERDRRYLNRIVRDNRKATAVKITADLNGHLQNLVFIKTVCQELNRSRFYGRAAIRKPLVSNSNASKRKEWCKNLQIWSSSGKM
jgi:transposase